MIPVVLGTIASSRRNQPASDSYTVAVDCAGSGPFTIYVLPGKPISTGTNTIVYTNNSLTTLLTNTSFVYLNYTYSVDGSGLITGAAVCYRQWLGYSGCNSYRDNPSISNNYYTAFSQTTLQTGVIVYTDPELLTPITDGTSFVADGVIYTSSGAAEPGAITSTAACVYSILYNTTGCGLGNYITFYTYSSTLDNYSLIGYTIYANSDPTVPITNASIYRYDNITYLLTNDIGVVVNVITCPT
jgi:hypothetical protein